MTAPYHTIETELLKVFRRFVAEGEIGGTLCMRSHVSVQRATTKYFSNSFVFKNDIAAWGAGGPRFESGRPDQNISRVFFGLLKAPFTPTPHLWNSGRQEV